MTFALSDLFPVPMPLIGMVHLLPLPGAPAARPMEEVLERALADARALIEGGIDGLLVENFQDRPFFRTRVPPVTVAAMSVVVREIVREAGKIPVGVNVLRNDGQAALAVAVAADARFIRVNVLSGSMLTDQGLIQGEAAKLLRARSSLGADGIALFADVLVKHAVPLAQVCLEDAVKDLVTRALADAVIVSGAATGTPAALEDLKRAQAAAGSTPVLLGSGLTCATAEMALKHAAGAIVGSGLKHGGRVEAGVDVARVFELVTEVKRLRF